MVDAVEISAEVCSLFPTGSDKMFLPWLSRRRGDTTTPRNSIPGGLKCETLPTVGKLNKDRPSNTKGRPGESGEKPQIKMAARPSDAPGGQREGRFPCEKVGNCSSGKTRNDQKGKRYYFSFVVFSGWYKVYKM